MSGLLPLLQDWTMGIVYAHKLPGSDTDRSAIASKL